VIAVPTTTVDVLRGTAATEFGDVVEADTVEIAGVPASIVEQRQQPYEPKAAQDRIVRFFKGRLPHGTGVQKGDRLRDSAGTVYVVDNVYLQANPWWKPDQAVDLSITT
jgi:hypothetical protein